MTERERLIELLKHDSCKSPMLCDPNCQYANLCCHLGDGKIIKEWLESEVDDNAL